MIRIVVPFLFMIYDSSSNQIYDFCIFTFFQNLTFLQTPIYPTNLTNLTDLTDFTILQSYRQCAGTSRTSYRQCAGTFE